MTTPDGGRAHGPVGARPPRAGGSAGRSPDADGAVVADRPRTLSTTATQAARELALILTGFQLYRWGRLLTRDDVARATDNATSVLHVEALLRLPGELQLQALALRSDRLIELANIYYAWVHFPVTGAVLVWLFLRRPRDYAWFRGALMALTVRALVLHLLVPLAPPRMMPGFVDTGLVLGQSVYTGSAGHLANQIAAMPSLHVGWSVLVAVALVATVRSPLRWLAVLHPVTTLAVVIVTGNHYWLDGVVAIALLASVLALLAPAPIRQLPWLEQDRSTDLRCDAQRG